MLTEAYNGRDFSEFSVADALRDGEAGNGDSGEDVILEHAESVFGQPFKDGNKVL